MSTTTFTTLFHSPQQASSFTAALRDTLTRRNEDLRTLGHSKALHAMAEASGFNNWHSMEASLFRKAFITIMMRDYGCSEAYADAAALTLGSGFDRDPETAVKEYAKRVPTLSRTAAPSAPVSTSSKVDPKQAEALSFIDDLRESTEDDPIECYGGGLQVKVILKLSSSATLAILVDPEDSEVLSAEVRVAGFGSAHIEPVPDDMLEHLGAVYATEIEDQLISLIHSR